MTTRNYVLTNTHIHTMNPQEPMGRAVHIHDGRISTVNKDEANTISSTDSIEHIDMGGRTILPGLCDAHIHIEKYALMLDQIDCETTTLEECLRRVEERCKVTAPGDWVLGHGWNQNTWGRYGTLQELNSVSPKNPVYITAKSLHASWANSSAIELSGISDAVEDPPKGKLQRDSRGRLTGILFEDAMLLISRSVPKPSKKDLVTMILHAQRQLHSWGITAIHDFDGLRCLDALIQIEEDNDLKLRILKHIREKEFEAALEGNFRSEIFSDWIRIGHLKLFADGALGPRTAAMLRSYEGEPDNLGMLLFSREELINIGKAAVQAGYPLAIHAIGDKANRTALDAIEELNTLHSSNHLPFHHRIEHVQLLHPDDVSRPSQLGITVSMQPIHAVSDQKMADQYWGDRVRWSYAWKSQLNSGANVIFGSDAPVEPPDPWVGLHAAIARQPIGDDETAPAWIPEERVTPTEALRAYTSTPAQISAWKSKIGQITEGYFADLIVLDQDVMVIEPEKIKQIRPCGVMVNGEWVIREF